jgi:hypothetical protein
MTRKLTHKQSEFAIAVAQGAPLAQAYRTAYKPTNAKAATVYSNSRRAVRHPKIAARIQELQVELLPAPEDMRAVYAHGLATIIQLSVSSADARVRLRAAEWLCAEAEKREKLEAAQRPSQGDKSERERLIYELRGLYAKALGPQEPLVEEGSDMALAEEAEVVPGGDY